MQRNEVDTAIRLSGETFSLFEPALAREMSLPFPANRCRSPLLESHRLIQGVLHNPKLDDGSAMACPPFRALLHIMASGEYEGMTIDDAEVRKMFSRDCVLKSDWYAQRLKHKQARDAALCRSNRDYLQQQLDETLDSQTGKKTELEARIAQTQAMLETVSSEEYIDSLTGTLGADWVHL